MATSLRKANIISPSDLSGRFRELLDNQSLHHSREPNSTRLQRALQSGVFQDQHISVIATELSRQEWFNNKHIGLEIDADVLCIWLGTKSISVQTILDKENQDDIRCFNLIRSDGLWDRRIATNLSYQQVIVKLQHYARAYSIFGLWPDKIRRALFGISMGLPRKSIRNTFLQNSFLGKLLQSSYSISITKLSDVDNIFLVSLVGEIDLYNYPAYKKELHNLIPSRAKCIIDLSRFRYGSSIGPLPLVSIRLLCNKRRTIVAVINYDHKYVLEGLFRIGNSTMLQLHFPREKSRHSVLTEPAFRE